MPFSLLEELEQSTGLLSVDRVAQLFGVKQNKIYKEVKKPAPAGMPCVKLGAQIKFDPATLIAWVCRNNPGLAAMRKQVRKEAA